jgi:NAD-specific glutamate dehydrogenase
LGAQAPEREFGSGRARLFRRYVRLETPAAHREATLEQVPRTCDTSRREPLEVRVIPRSAEVVAVNLYSMHALGLTDILKTLQHLGLTVTEELRAPLSLPDGRHCFLYRFELDAPSHRIAALHWPATGSWAPAPLDKGRPPAT